MLEKKFKTLDEQIEILRSRNLTIANEDKAKDFLLHNNYYRISGFSLTLRKNDIFDKSATFQNIIDIYNFDFELRHIILQYIEIIEIQIKSIYAYEFTKIHGPTGYLNDELFTDKNQHRKIIAKANKLKNKRLPHEAYLKHFINDLHQDIPLWAFVDLLTISDISFFYSISEQQIKEIIANLFGLKTKKASIILGKYMHSMTLIRNLCAHGGRLYNRIFEQKPSLNSKEKALLIKNEHGQIDNAHFYGFVLIMRRLLPRDTFNEMKEKIITITKKYPFVRMEYYGFRNDWQEKI
jgi:abortive infection bacteriophage resistance protein